MMNNNINYNNDDVMNLELLREKVVESVQVLHDYTDFVVKEYKFDKEVDLEFNLPHFFIGVDMPYPNCFKLTITFVDYMDAYFRRKMDCEIPDEYRRGRDDKVSSFLELNLMRVIKKYLNDEHIVSMLQRINTRTTENYVTTTYSYDVEIKR